MIDEPRTGTKGSWAGRVKLREGALLPSSSGQSNV